MNHQISMTELLEEQQTTEKPAIRYQPSITVCDEHTDAYRIPEGIWETRCKYCIHKNADQNIPVPKAEVHRPYMEIFLPCRIMAIAHPGERMAGECFSFAQRNVYGICATCKHDNVFCEGWCTKAGHGEEKRVFYGVTYPNSKPDYWGRHRLCVCDDYEPEADDLIKTGE